MATHDIIVIGASAGGLEALTRLIGALPPRITSSIFVVMHFPAFGTSKLPQILSREGHVIALHPEASEDILPNRIYVAPPDRHLVLEGGKVKLSRGPRQNGFRPSIDVLFRSAARAFGPRTVGILLSGLLDDGVYGMQMIKRHGGLTIVQDPEEAAFGSLPQAALQAEIVDQTLTVSQIAELIGKNSTQPHKSTEGAPMTENDRETDKMDQDIEKFEGNGKDHTYPSVITCPDCGGVLWETQEGGVNRYRCHVGHTYSTESMLEEQARAIESALWSATRALRERAFLMRRLASLSEKQGAERMQKRYLEQAEELEEGADLLRLKFLDDQEGSTPQSQVAPPED